MHDCAVVACSGFVWSSYRGNWQTLRRIIISADRPRNASTALLTAQPFALSKRKVAIAKITHMHCSIWRRCGLGNSNTACVAKWTGICVEMWDYECDLERQHRKHASSSPASANRLSVSRHTHQITSLDNEASQLLQLMHVADVGAFTLRRTARRVSSVRCLNGWAAAGWAGVRNCACAYWFVRPVGRHIRFDSNYRARER